MQSTQHTTTTMGNKQQHTRRSCTGGGELQKVFGRFDADGDGRISRSELRRALRAMGTEASDAEVGAMMEEMDSDRDGFVDLKEFEQFHCGGGGGGGIRGEEEEELRDAFDAYDLDRNGLISAKELHMVMRRLGEKCSVKDCQRMIRSVDSDGDGCVSLPEFKKMMMVGARPR